MKKRKAASKKSKLNLKSSEFNYLPPELWTRILASLPVKTLLRFRCVCKTWCSIIDNPNFIPLHFERCSNNNDKLLVSLERLKKRGDQGTLLTIRRAATLRKIAHIFQSCKRYFFYGSCNGLFLTWSMVSMGSELRLWNPSIRKSLLIPPCPLRPACYRGGLLAFGFASCSKDYKIISVPFEGMQDNNRKTICYAVYTLSSQQWTVRSDDMNIGYERFKRGMVNYCLQKNGFSFKGAVFWFERDIYAGKATHLVSLDIDLEKFTFSDLPHVSDETETLRFLFRLGESLAIFCIASKSTNIWVLEQDNRKWAWTLWFSGNSSSDGYKLFLEYWGDGSVTGFYYESDAGYFVCGNKSYNITTCQVQELNKSMLNYFNLETYSESLVLWQGYGAEDMMSTK